METLPLPRAHNRWDAGVAAEGERLEGVTRPITGRLGCDVKFRDTGSKYTV